MDKKIQASYASYINIHDNSTITSVLTTMACFDV